MIKGHTLILSIILSWLPFLVLSQKIYEGQVLDKITETPLFGTTVTLVKKNVSVKVNDQGYFKLTIDNEIVDDLLIFKFIGYKSIEIPVKNYKNYLYVQLEATVSRLDEVKITASKRKERILEKFSLSDIKEESITEVVGIANYQITAKLFTTPASDAKLLRIQSGRRDFANNTIKANSFAHFIVHVLGINDKTQEPGEILFTKEVKLRDNSHLFTVEFKNDNVILPSKFFIAIERLFIPFNEVINVGSEKKVAGLDKKGRQILEDV